MKRKYDLIVAGGGPAGVAAAVAAARYGIRVLLIERAGYLGGMATDGGIPAFCPYTDGEKAIIRGIGYEILTRMRERSYISPFYDEKPDRIRGLDWVPIDSEVLKLVLDEIVAESGCDVLFHTVVTAVDCQDGILKGVTIFNKSGLTDISGNYFADCTGDGDIVAMAGGEYEYGDEDGLVQAATLCFKIGNFDTGRFMAYAREAGEDGNLSQASKRAIKDGAFPKGEKHVLGISLYAKGMAALNFGHVFGCQPVSGADLSKAEMEARKRLPKLLSFLRRYVPGAEEAVLAASGPHIGIRESRRIVGDYQMTMADYYQRQDHPDAIAYYSYPIDMHASNCGNANQEQAAKVYQGSKYNNGECYGIPYRALLPRGLYNLVAAGRIISADRAMMASVRVMPACFGTGEAAGTAAYLAAREGIALRQIPPAVLRQQLKTQGAYIKDRQV